MQFDEWINYVGIEDAPDTVKLCRALDAYLGTVPGVTWFPGDPPSRGKPACWYKLPTTACGFYVALTAHREAFQGIRTGLPGSIIRIATVTAGSGKRLSNDFPEPMRPYGVQVGEQSAPAVLATQIQRWHGPGMNVTKKGKGEMRVACNALRSGGALTSEVLGAVTALSAWSQSHG